MCLLSHTPSRRPRRRSIGMLQRARAQQTLLVGHPAASPPGSPAGAQTGTGKQKKGARKPKEHKPELIVHGARDDFMAILRQRNQVEMEARMPRPVVRQVNMQGVQDLAVLTKLLKIPVERRTNADEVLIANQIRYTGIFEQLYISADQEPALCKILHLRKFMTKGATVVHEGQSRGSFYMLVDGTLVVLASRRSALLEGAEHKPKNEKYVLIVNIVEALSLAAADKSGTSDPFVTVTCGTKEESTTVKKETLNPIWDENVRIFDVDTRCVPSERRERERAHAMVMLGPSFPLI